MKKLIRNSTDEFLIFTAQTGNDSVEVRVEHELEEDSVCREFRHAGSGGKFYNTRFYNLDTIIPVGYRVKSHTATRFRQWWVAAMLREYLFEGFMLDDECSYSVG